MNRGELLKWMKPRITKYHYEILELWLKEDSQISANTKFKIEATPFETGYIIRSSNWWSSNHIFVYI
jgi:hypothetical protein